MSPNWKSSLTGHKGERVSLLPLYTLGKPSRDLRGSLHGALRGALLAAALGSAAIQAAPPPAPAEEPITAADITVRYMLQNHFGRVITDQDYVGKYQLITFGYTHCPDICPTTLAEMAQVLNQLGDKAERVQALFITLDPERDTPQVLRPYVTYFHPAIMGLTGTPELVSHAAANFRVRYEKVHEPGAPPDQYWMDHSAGIYLLSPNEEFLAKFAYATPVAELAKRVGELVSDGEAKE